MTFFLLKRKVCQEKLALNDYKDYNLTYRLLALGFKYLEIFREQQCKMAKYMDEIFGDLLLKDFLPNHPRKKGIN